MMLGMLSDTKDDEAVPRTKRLALCQHLKNKTVVCVCCFQWPLSTIEEQDRGMCVLFSVALVNT